MIEPGDIWDLYWETRLAPWDTLGKSAAIRAASKEIRRLAQPAGRPLRLLELGCGEGQILGTLLDAHADLCDRGASVGIDLNRKSLARCQKDYPGVHWEQGDFTAPDLLARLGKFDLILFVNALHEVFSAVFSPELGEVDVPLAKQQVREVLSHTVDCLHADRCLVLFDGLEPTGNQGRKVRIRFLSDQARAEFETFTREYRPFQIKYGEADTSGLVELSQHNFTRYITKSIFLGKRLWETERLESYQYFTEAEFREALIGQGLELTALETLTLNGEKWRSRVEIDPPDAEFPQEHVLIVAYKRPPPP